MDKKSAYEFGALLAVKNCGLIKEAKWPWEKEESAFKSWIPWAAGAGLGLGSYALLRHPFKTNPMKYPALRKIQDLAEGEMWSRTRRLEDTPLGRLKDWFMYGPMVQTSKVKEITQPGKLKAVFHGYDPVPPEGTFDPLIGPVTGEEAQKAYDLARTVTNDKLRQAALLQEYAPGSVARSFNVSDILKKHNIQLTPENLPEGLRKLQEALKKEFGESKYILKTRGERVGGDPVAQSRLSSFPTGESNLEDLYKGWEGIREKFHKVLNERSPSSAIHQFRDDPAYPGRVIEEILHDNALAQEVLPIKKYTGRTAEKMIEKGHSPTVEYRVHSIGGKSIPSLALPRFSTGGPQDILEFFKARKVSKEFQKMIDKLPPEYRDMPIAADIAELEGGGYRVIEMNPAGESGFLNHPLMRHPLHRAVTGASSKPVAALAAPVIGGIGTTGTGVGMNLAND